jgi:hypothetical protein
MQSWYFDTPLRTGYADVLEEQSGVQSKFPTQERSISLQIVIPEKDYPEYSRDLDVFILLR